MPAIYDDLDLEFSFNGDYLLSDEGDLRDTSYDGLQSLKDQIHDILASSLNDWELYPNRGATLGDFVGEPNVRRTGNQVHDRIRLALTSTGLIREEDLRIRVVPVQIYKILIILTVDVIPTPANKLTSIDRLKVALVFDTVEQQTLFFEKTPNLIAS